ncbi:hypothetical protein [Ruegeria sp. EL01]|uniref:hypothetical protein n=1 Tax=Ruegeria sp. EL01 TaxID=2107578 RepID=UPI0013C4FFA9|nr:hypothetical protein [Ruegeria sp. EL01]
MKNLFLMLSFAMIGIAASACRPENVLGYESEPTTQGYTEPFVSGLKVGDPYPTQEEVCVRIKKNNATSDLVEAGYFLIGCPKHEKGAIEDRMSEGAKVVAHSKHWTLLQVSDGTNL